MPTLEFKFRVDGTLTNATSVVLSDPTGTFGVKRLDNGATVVADGTAMTNVATGVYRHTFTAPAEGLTYSWFAEAVYNGVTYRFEREFADASAIAVTTWGTRAGIEQKVGVVNLKEYVFLGDTNENPQADPEPASIAPAIADDIVEAATDMAVAWRQHTSVALGFANPFEQRWLADTNEYGAAVKAWAGRNIDRAQTDEVPQQVATAMREWDERLAMLRGGTALLDYQGDNGVGDDDTSPAGTFKFLRINRGTRCRGDEFSSCG